MSRMKELDVARLNSSQHPVNMCRDHYGEGHVGQDTTAPARRRLYRSLEDDVALMERDWELLVEKARLVRHWLDLDCRPTEGFDDLMKALGIHDRIITKPQAEMACHHED